MRILYITTKEFDHGIKDGVVKKIYSQINCFKSCGFKVDLIHMKNSEKAGYFVSDELTKKIGTYKVLSGVFGKKIIAHFLENHLKTEKYEFAYIRFPDGRNDPWTMEMLNALKKNNVKIVFEFPTYPYDLEKRGVSAKMDLAVDRMFRGKLKKYVDRVVTYSPDKDVYGVETINIHNGITVSELDMIVPVVHAENELHIMAVALFQPYHGYERIIQGIADYKKNGGQRKIVLHMVGDGSEREGYENLVSRLEEEINTASFKENVIFHGRQSGKELAAIYNEADIALGSLGYYKNGLEISSNLKIREYLAKGVPFVTGCTEDIFDKGEQDFYFRVPNDSSPVDMEAVIKWYDRLLIKYRSKQELAEKLRQYAFENADVSVTFKPIINYMLENV